MLDLFLSASRLGRADFACSVHMMLVSMLLMELIDSGGVN